VYVERVLVPTLYNAMSVIWIHKGCADILGT